MPLLPENSRATVALLALSAVLAFCTVQFTVGISGSIQHFVVYWLYNALVLGAGGGCLARGASDGRERWAWTLIGIAVVAWGVGNVIWTFVYLGQSAPYPSLADAFW